MERSKIFYCEISEHFPLPRQEPVLASLVKPHRNDLAQYRLVEVYEKFIIGYADTSRNKPAYKISLAWEVNYEMIRDKSANPQGNEPINPPYGVKIQCPEKTIQYYWPEESKNPSKQTVKALQQNAEKGSELKDWRLFLATKINQRGFHELYRPQKKIGKGNFASVYLAIRLQDNKKVAVKAFSKQSTYSEEFGKESLINQIELMRKLNHKNLMKLYDVFESQNSIYMCVELLEGGQLYDKVKVKHKFNYVEVSQIMRGILLGLEHMHAKRIMHRDLKPENIILRKQKDYDCVIADFGLSTWADQDKYLFARCGTPGYVAPEIVNLRDLHGKCEPVCDMFSVGIIFHILLLGRSPFVGKTYNQVLAENRACRFNFDAEQYRLVSKEAIDLLRKLLAKKPEDRITAEKALKHSFFVFAEEMSNTVKSFEIPEELLRMPNHKAGGGRTSILATRKQRASLVCNSPLMTTANNLRKQFPTLNEDSCIKFKMQDAVYDGSIAGCDSSQSSFESSGMSKTNSPMHGGANCYYPAKESRFASKPKENKKSMDADSVNNHSQY